MGKLLLENLTKYCINCMFYGLVLERITSLFRKRKENTIDTIDEKSKRMKLLNWYENLEKRDKFILTFCFSLLLLSWFIPYETTFVPGYKNDEYILKTTIGLENSLSTMNSIIISFFIGVSYSKKTLTKSITKIFLSFLLIIIYVSILLGNAFALPFKPTMQLGFYLMVTSTVSLFFYSFSIKQKTTTNQELEEEKHN